MSTQPNPILPWHDDTAVAIMHSDYTTIHDIAVIIAAHDPHAAQHAEAFLRTLNLWRDET